MFYETSSTNEMTDVRQRYLEKHMESLIKSLLTCDNPFNTTDEVLAWIERRNLEVAVRVEAVLCI